MTADKRLRDALSRNPRYEILTVYAHFDQLQETEKSLRNAIEFEGETKVELSIEAKKGPPIVIKLQLSQIRDHLEHIVRYDVGPARLRLEGKIENFRRALQAEEPESETPKSNGGQRKGPPPAMTTYGGSGKNTRSNKRQTGKEMRMDKIEDLLARLDQLDDDEEITISQEGEPPLTLKAGDVREALKASRGDELAKQRLKKRGKADQ